MISAGDVSTEVIFTGFFWWFLNKAAHQLWFFGMFWSNSCCQGEIWPLAVAPIPCVTVQHWIYSYAYILPISRTCLYVYILSNAQNVSRSHSDHLVWLASIETEEMVNAMLKKDHSYWCEAPTGRNFG